MRKEKVKFLLLLYTHSKNIYILIEKKINIWYTLNKVGGMFMAKRGRPSNKTIKKRKVAKSKSELSLLVAVFVVVLLFMVGYFMLFNK